MINLFKIINEGQLDFDAVYDFALKPYIGKPLEEINRNNLAFVERLLSP